MPPKRKSMGVGDRVARAVDTTINDFIIRKTATIILENNVDRAPDITILTKATEGVPLPFAAVRAEGSATMASHNLWQDGSWIS